jgi:PTH1 family peptidyl-tRNA hydrolase
MAAAVARADSPSPPIRLVTGLGNPGREYERTRHNVGFLVLDRLASRQRLDWSFSSAWQAQWNRGSDGNFFLKPLTYMNLSGRSVRAFSQFYKLTAEQTLIVYDDLALPLGQLRLRREGSSGGQNGMQSIIEHLGTSAVPRLRVGIGAVRGGRSMVDHVLSEFSGAEREILDEALDRAADAVEHACRHGVEPAMNLFNRSPAQKPASE